MKALKLLSLLGIIVGLVLLFKACIVGGGGTGGEGLTGVVVDESGAPVLGASVGAYSADGGTKTVVTDASGRFRISSLKAGTYNLAASYQKNDSTFALFIPNVEVLEDTDLGSRTLLLSGELQCGVKAYEGDPIVGARCEIPASPYVAVSDTGGQCTFKGLAPGSYRVGIVPEDGDTTYTESLEVESGIVSGGTTITVMTGPDLGENWIKRNSGTRSDLYAVMWTGREYVAVGDTGTVVFSDNGSSWVVRRVGDVRARLRGITRTDSLFVAVGAGILDSGVIFTSPTGEIWTRRSSVSWGLNTVTWTGSRLIAVGEEGGIWTSPDGVVWDSATSGTTARLTSVAGNGTILVAVGSGSFFGNSPRVILTSTDGQTWTNRSDANTPSSTFVLWNGRRFYAGGNGLVTSLDGINWVSPYPSGSFLLSGVWAGDGLMSTGYYTSNNAGGIWSMGQGGDYINRYATQPYVYLNAIAARPYLQLVVVGDEGTILTSH